MYPRKRYLLDDEYGPQTQMQAHQQSFYENLPDWASEKEPYVLETVSRRSPQRRRNWLAHGNVAQKRRELKQQRDEMIFGPMRQRMATAERDRPMGDREKLLMQQGFAEKTASRTRADRLVAATLLHQRGMEKQQAGQQFTAGESEVGQGFQTERDLAQFGRRKEFAQFEQDIQPPTVSGMRAEYIGGLPRGTPEFERGLGIPQEDPYANILSMAEQEAMVLAQFEYGSVGWQQAYQQIEAIKRAPIDPVQKMRELQMIARGALKTGWGGAMGEEMETQKGVGAWAQNRIDALMNPQDDQDNNVLTEEEVIALLREAGGDINLARQLAAQRGLVIPP